MYHCYMDVYEALKEMRALSRDNIPFSISFITYNGTNDCSDGLRIVNRCILRKGLSIDKSDKARVLISYTDLENNKEVNRCFYLPLLIGFNNIILD